MEELMKELKGYLVMENELPFEEFDRFYRKLMRALTEGFEGMSNESRVQARYACQIVASNATARVGESRALAKKFRKISEKCSFWADAIDYRLDKEGLSKTDIENMTEAVQKSIEDVEKSVDTVENPANTVGTQEKSAESSGVSGEKIVSDVDKPAGSVEKDFPSPDEAQG